MKRLQLVSLIAIFILAFGCTTTTTHPDGTVEVESLDPAALAVLQQIVDAIVEIQLADDAADRQAASDDADELQAIAVALLPPDIQDAALRAIAAAKDDDPEALIAALKEIREAQNGAGK